MYIRINMISVFDTITLSMRSFSDGDTIRAATKLIRITRTALVIWSCGRGEAIRTATISCILATAALVVWTTSSGAVIWTASESRVLAATTVEIWTASWKYVVWTALERCRQTTTLFVWTMSRSATVIATAISTVFAGHVTAIVVGTQSYMWCLLAGNYLRKLEDWSSFLYLIYSDISPACL